MSTAYERIKELFGERLPFPMAPMTGKNAAQSRAQGWEALENEDYEAAIAHFKRAVEQTNARSPWALMDLGAAFASCDNVPQAFRQYEKAKRIQKSGELMIALASLFQHQGRHADAIQRLKEGVDLEPENAMAHYKLAEALRRAGHKREAVHAANVAVACAPDQAFYHYWLGELLLELGQFDEAQAALHAAIELSPSDDNLYFLASQAFWGQGKKAKAVSSIRLAGDIATENHFYAGLLERYLRNAGLVSEADQEKRRASRMEPYDREMLRKVSERLRLTDA